jgi:organic radical activating enzyme
MIFHICNLNCPMCVSKDTREQGFLDEAIKTLG